MVATAKLPDVSIYLGRITSLIQS